MNEWNETCRAMHIGLWAIQPEWLIDAVAAVKAGLWVVETEARAPGVPITKDQSGIAIIGIQGQMTKGSSKFGGTSSLQVRRQVREATRDESVRGIMLVVDSPGGFVAGTADLADEVHRAAETKPVRAHVEDLGASAAYWVASQADQITAGKTAEVGSIGSMAIVSDTSKAAEMEGVKVHVVATGDRKGDRIPGTPVTDDMLGDVKERVEAVNQHFLEAVTRGRGVDEETLSTWTSGKVWIAEKAQKLGLIDGVSTLEDAMDSFRADVAPPPNHRTAIQNTQLRELEGRVEENPLPAEPPSP